MNESAARTVARSPYLEGPYAPVDEERVVPQLEVVAGAIPRDLEGTFVRNGSNPKLPPRGRYHWFDGDGMLHAIELGGGKASYRNRYVRTAGLTAELEAGEPLWTGIYEPVDLTNPRGPFKNTANTDVVFHAGKLFALWWQSGVPYRVRLPDLETLGEERFRAETGGAVTMAAHPKVDPRTGELMFISFGPCAPFLSYGVLGPRGELVHRVPISSVPGPRYQHDIAITERFTVLMDLPLFSDPELLAVGKDRVRFYRDRPARFGLIPRHGADVRWFEASPCYVYHTINAWEERTPTGDVEVVLLGCRINDPLMGDPGNPKEIRPIPAIGLQRLEPYLHEWRMNLATGRLTERRLGDALVEFPRMDNRRLGVRSRYSFCPRMAQAPTLLFTGLVKHDRERGVESVHEYPEGWSAGEAVVCPREGSTGEDDAYVLTLALEGATGKSELWIWSASDFGAPLARVAIPARVPVGYHAWWVPAAEGRAS